jgi:hypothetical protein
MFPNMVYIISWWNNLHSPWRTWQVPPFFYSHSGTFIVNMDWTALKGWLLSTLQLYSSLRRDLGSETIQQEVFNSLLHLTWILKETLLWTSWLSSLALLTLQPQSPGRVAADLFQWPPYSLARQRRQSWCLSIDEDSSSLTLSGLWTVPILFPNYFF